MFGMMFSAGGDQSMNMSLFGASTANGPLGRHLPRHQQRLCGNVSGHPGAARARINHRQRDASKRRSLGDRQPGVGCFRATPSLDLHPLVTDAELRDAAVAKLKQTTVGYKNKYWTVPPAAPTGRRLSLCSRR